MVDSDLMDCDLQIASAGNEILLPTRDYDLDATFSSGQVFGWQRTEDGRWHGVMRGHYLELRSVSNGILARSHRATNDWSWLREFLQCDVNLADVLASFPATDVHLQTAVNRCRGLRLLRQDPWECLAGFILSSTKQIVQIQQIVRLLCERYGAAIRTGNGVFCHAFPTAAELATVSEADLRTCKMGFRAPYLLAAARRVAAGEINLAAIQQLELDAAREELLRFDGVGTKIADCVLLFAYGFPQAFPVDVWVRRVLTGYYFRGRRVKEERLRRFITEHFGPHAGYAQQYLFHYIRTVAAKESVATRSRIRA